MSKSTLHWRGHTYALPNRHHDRPRTRAGLSIQQVDYNADIRTLKGLRLALVLQQRTESEWLALKATASQRQLELAELFPFAAVQESRKSYRDPGRPEASDKIFRNLNQGFYERVPEYIDFEGRRRYKKWCPGCSDWQRREAFGVDESRPDGLRGYCNTCCADKQREYRARKRDEQLAAAA